MTMTVEERRGSMGKDDGPRDQFPVGMRVLAVDDDLVSLKLMESLLRRCQYQVTTCSEAITALTLLRENKDKYDLIISDVHMPDMDGFKLSKHVGLEMDLPVILLSADSETEAVMKGISHGACDYLLKPVRIEELGNIWQHVIRRRKFGPRDHNNENGEDFEKPQHANSEGGQGTSGSSDRNGGKRKDQDGEDDIDGEENMYENEDPGTQKKPKFFWSVELHLKFIAAVNQLGIDKAVPKRILDLMNVERLTRENVASHLQKYRLYLKRLSAVASQQANMVTAVAGRDPSYLPMGSLDRVGNFHALGGSGQLPALTSFQPGGVLGRVNCPTSLGFHGLASSGMIQPDGTHNNTSNPINDLGNLQRISILGNQHGNLLQGMPTSLGLDQLQQQKVIKEANNRFPSGFSGTGLATGGSSNTFVNVTNSPLLLQAPQQHLRSGGLINCSSARIPSSCSNPFGISVGVSSHLPDLGRCNDTWQGATPLTRYSENNLPMGAPLNHDNLSTGNMGNNVLPMVSHLDSNPHALLSSSAVVAPLPDPVLGIDVQCQASSLGGNMTLIPMGIGESSKTSNFRSIDNFRQKWEEQKHDYVRNSNVIFNSSLNSSLPNHSLISPTAESQRSSNVICTKKMDLTMNGQSNFGSPFFTQNCKFVKSPADGELGKYKDEYILGMSKLQGGFSSNGCSTDDLVNAMIKPSGCCKPPTECGFNYQNATVWAKPNGIIPSNNTDCNTWNNDQSILCYDCQSCKAGVLANIKHDWKKVVVVNIIFLVFFVIVYSIGCCAFGNNRVENAYPR